MRSLGLDVGKIEIVNSIADNVSSWSGSAKIAQIEWPEKVFLKLREKSRFMLRLSYRSHMEIVVLSIVVHFL